ncbi:MAG: ATP-binding protein [Acidobacteriota bacterium]|nr:ATP-binding protein [Acidobacteriota bacterium]
MMPDDPHEASRRTLTIRSELSEIDKARAFLRESLAPCRLDEEEIFKLELALVEICVNITRYAYPDGGGPIGLTLWIEPGICLEIRDSGVPFDPRLLPPPDLDRLLASSRRGGLGVYLARKLVDDFDYKRENEENIVTLSRCLPFTN